MPLDDSGASTADRYDWQAAMAAADGLAMYLDGIDDAGRLRPDCHDKVLCEWHEDWMVYRNDQVELVSAKHRDPRAGAYTTVTKLASEGGLAHLLDRWAALHEKVSCRLVTSGGLGSGAPQELLAAARLFRVQKSSGQPVVVAGAQVAIVTQFRKAIESCSDDTKLRWEQATSPGADHAECDAEVARFLAALTISEGQLQRDHVEFAAPAMYVKPILDRLSSIGQAEAVWTAIVGLFRLRMRSRGPLPTGGLPLVGNQTGTTGEGALEMQRTLAARTVTMTDIHTAVSAALAVPGGYRPVPPLVRSSRLEVKMNVGGCSDNAIERALRLRSDYQDYWRDRESLDPTARAERQRLERRLHRISDEATGTFMPVGAVLWSRLQAAVDELPNTDLPTAMDADLALGGICDLAGRCKVWFGPQFDVKAVIAEVRAGKVTL